MIDHMIKYSMNKKRLDLRDCLHAFTLRNKCPLRVRLPYAVFRQVGAHLWHEGSAGGLSGIRTHNLLTLACLEVQALPLSYHLLLDDRNYVLRLLRPCHLAMP